MFTTDATVFKRRMVYFAAVFVPLAVLIGALLTVIYVGEARTEKEVLETGEKVNLAAIEDVVEAEFGAIRADLLFLTDHHELRSYVNGDTGALDAILGDFLAFSTRKGVYDQIRYLDETGMEVVRINYNAGSPSVVPAAKLQNKGQRYYFTDVIGLNRGEVFASPLDLNMENGAIEQPLKPMIRFGTPIFDDAGNRRGIVLLNYFGAGVLNAIDSTSRSAGNVMVMNPDGYFLRAESADEEWGFMYEERSEATFGNKYVAAAAELGQSGSGVVETAQGLFVTTMIHPLAAADGTSSGSATATGSSDGVFDSSEYYWTVVARVPAEVLAAGLGSVRGSLIRVFAILLAVLAVGSYAVATLFARQRMSRRELERFAAELERSNRELDDFARIASHDLQEPLRKVAAFGDRLKTKYAAELGEQGKDYIDRMHSATERMRVLIEDLLKYSRVTTKAQPFETVDLDGVIDGVISDLEVRLDEVDGKIDVGDLPTVDADPLQMRQLFQNLVGNALKFHRPDATPVVSIGAVDGAATNGSGRTCKIVVRDNGIGFDPAQAERIFGTFERLHGRSEYEGTGVGLSICRKIVERHGGNIVATAVPGEGATFTITLPMAQQAA